MRTLERRREPELRIFRQVTAVALMPEQDRVRHRLWPTSLREVEPTIRRLKIGGRQDLFVFLVVAAAGAEWKIFSKAMEIVCDLSPREMRDLLAKVCASPAWSAAYATARLPPALFSFFITVVRLGQAITHQSPEILPSQRLRVMVVRKALLESDSDFLVVPVELRAELIA